MDLFPELTVAAETYGKHLVATESGAVGSHCVIPGTDDEGHVMVVAVRLHKSSKPEDVIQRAHTALIELMTGK